MDKKTKSKLPVKSMGARDAQESQKKEALQTVLDRLEKDYGRGAVMRLGEVTHMQVSAIPTGSAALDIALGVGGIPRGRIVEIYGPESSGKTTLALHILAEAQKGGGEVEGNSRGRLYTYNQIVLRSL